MLWLIMMQKYSGKKAGVSLFLNYFFARSEDNLELSLFKLIRWIDFKELIFDSFNIFFFSIKIIINIKSFDYF